MIIIFQITLHFIQQNTYFYIHFIQQQKNFNRQLLPINFQIDINMSNMIIIQNIIIKTFVDPLMIFFFFFEMISHNLNTCITIQWTFQCMRKNRKKNSKQHKRSLKTLKMSTFKLKTN